MNYKFCDICGKYSFELWDINDLYKTRSMKKMCNSCFIEAEKIRNKSLDIKTRWVRKKLLQLKKRNGWNSQLEDIKKGATNA